jgi:hypothetical protein
LPQRVVEALNVVGFACVFRDGFVTLRRDDTLVHVIVIGMKRQGNRIKQVTEF